MDEQNRPIAIFAIHGMGTHLPMSGVQDAVKVLRKMKNAGAEVLSIESRIESVAGRETTVSQARVSLIGDGLPSQVTVVEANYAAIPKGKAGLGDVIRFLFMAGWNGLGASNWKRWLFGQNRDCRPKDWTHFVLVLVIGALGSLVGLNAAFTAELFGENGLKIANFHDAPTPFQSALCMAMVAILLVAALFVLFIIASGLLTKPALKRERSNALFEVVAFAGYVLFVFLPLVVVISAAYVGLHRLNILSAPKLDLTVNLYLFKAIRVLGAAAVLLVLVNFLANRPVMKIIYASALILAFVVLLAGDNVVHKFVITQQITRADFWILAGGFMAASAVFRSFMLNYAGDVNAYVAGSQASKFADVREAVQQRVKGALDFTLQDHDVIVLAHSLGAVVGYDAVNRALLCPPGQGRILSLITYGCPLDKIAYLFGTEDKHGDAVRNELVASRQPMVWASVRAKIPWYNVQAKYDIVGSNIVYYNQDPSKVQVDDVIPVEDETNLVPVASHSQYSDHLALPATLRRALLHAASGGTVGP